MERSKESIAQDRDDIVRILKENGYKDVRVISADSDEYISIERYKDKEILVVI